MTIVALELPGPDESRVDIGKIVAILSDLGGSAHLTDIYRRLCASAASDPWRDPPSKDEVLRALLAHRSPTPESTDPRLCFFQLYGCESYRWSLCTLISPGLQLRTGSEGRA